MPHNFYQMTWSDYSRYSQGYWIRHYRQMEGARTIAYYIAATNRDPKKSFPRTFDKFMPFPTEKHEPAVEIKPVTKEEYDAIIKRYSKNGKPDRT